MHTKVKVRRREIRSGDTCLELSICIESFLMILEVTFFRETLAPFVRGFFMK